MSKEVNVERAKLAEQAERYDDMAQVSLLSTVYLPRLPAAPRATSNSLRHVILPLFTPFFCSQ